MNKIKHIQTFTGGVNTVLAPELMQNNQLLYMLNCNVTSTAEGNIGIITHPKGNIPVQVTLPEGNNLTIGVAKNEEMNKMYFAVWNSLGYNSWYEFDAVSLTVKLIIQSITYTGGVDIFKWEKGKLILHANVIDGNLLYWSMSGHPARKINIQKALELNDQGYGEVILQEYTRAAKKTLPLPPATEYFTNTAIPSNNVYRNLFKFVARNIYDDGEYSSFSDFSPVAVPSEEAVTGVSGVPRINNGIYVRIQTGDRTVKKIEIAMQKTDQQSLTRTPSAWVSVAVLDKEVLGIPDNTEYAYEFYNNNTYLALNQDEVLKQQSDFPRNPEVQEYTSNRLVYGNYESGFPAVKVDFTAAVEYEELFVPDGTANVLNDPDLIYSFIDNYYESGGFLGGGGWRSTEGRITVGPDVKSGNKFIVQFLNYSFEHTVVATLNDDAKTIAAKMRSAFASNEKMNGSKGSYVGNIESDISGSASFTFRVWNDWNKPYISVVTFVYPVNYSTLKDTGNSVLNEKMGSSYRYAIRYENEDDERSLAYGGDEVVSIKHINELGGIKKVSTIITINHKAPYWATRYSIVRTKNLTQSDYIQMLVQRVVNVTSTTLSEQYQDVIIGSLSAYQAVHPNSTLTYEFKKGDRIRLLKTLTGSTWAVAPTVMEYEVMDYFPEVSHIIKDNIIVDGSAVVKTTPDANNIGNNIIVNGSEREIVGVTSDGYTLNSSLSINGSSSGSPQTFPSFTMVNRRGVLRIKMDPAFPIVADGVSNFSLVEVYNPAQTFTDAANENYYDIGYKFEIYEEGGVYYHRGNFQDQDASNPAQVKIGGVGNYVRNRELITNNSVTNPQSTLTSIEDSSYSDFYISNLNSYGRPTRLDDSRGVVKFDDRMVWSKPFIEDTRINGLNMFDTLDRVDYNDKYGSIKRIIFYEGRMYIFKFLKTGWVPVFGSIFTDTEGSPIVATSTRLLPDKMEYFLWEGGVGNNPESIVKEGNNIHGVSPTSEVIFEIGGGGVIPTSKIYGIDNTAREFITGASKAGVNMIGAVNRKNNQYVLMIDSYNIPAYSDVINLSNSRIVPVEDSGVYQIISPPSNGTLNLENEVLNYFPNFNFFGMDYYTYRSVGGITRQVCINVLSEDTQLVWKPEGEYCVVEAGVRTGYSGYSILSQFDNFTNTFTGITKPNIDTDPDYVAPIENLDACPVGMEYAYLATIDRRKATQTINFNITSVEEYNIAIKESSDFSSATIVETGMVSGVNHQLTLPTANSDAYLFLIVSNAAYDGVTEIFIDDAYITSANFNTMSELDTLVLNQGNIPSSHNNQFTSLSIGQLASLKTLKVIRHEMTSIDLSNNLLLEEIDVSIGKNLVNLTIGNWSTLKRLHIQESAFTASGYNPAFVNSVITNMDTLSVSPHTLQYGPGPNSGIMPSASVSPRYNSLIGKGVFVIGRNPNVSSVNLALTSFSIQDYVDFTLTLSASLPVNISIFITGFITDITSASVAVNQTCIIQAGQTVFNGNAYGTGNPIMTYDLYIQNVTPNPAGGVTINY